MTIFPLGFSIDALALPHEDPSEPRRLYSEWMSAYPGSGPIEQGLIQQAVVALIEKRRIERLRATRRTERVRTAGRYWDRAQEDHVAYALNLFNSSCGDGLFELTNTSAGCRWAIAFWEKLQKGLAEDGTWYGADRIGAIQLQGVSACMSELYLSEAAFMTWLDCLVAQPNPKQKDIDKILDPKCVPKALQDRDVELWPGNPAESRARLQALVDRELPRLRALEETLRVQYETPSRAEAEDDALASNVADDMPLHRAERMYEQSYQQTITALMKVRKQTAGSRPEPAAREVDPDAAQAPAPVTPAGGTGAWAWGRPRDRGGQSG